MTVLCGLCTLALGIGAMSDGVSGPEAIMALPTVGVIGGIPTLMGIGLFLLGRRLYRSPRQGDVA